MFTQAMDEAGFAVIESVFNAGEINALWMALVDAGLPRSRAGTRHAMQSSAVAAFANDERLLSIARAALGPQASPYRATLFDKSAAANWLVVWHQDTALPLRQRRDTPGWGPWSIKAGILYAHAPTHSLQQVLALRIHIDDSGELNGPLRVIPGSHRHGVLQDAEVQDIARHAQPVECVVAKGGVLAMKPLLIHASSKSRTTLPRRVLHVEYAASLCMETGLTLAVA
jgi:ectoine hydroxylase-related dioxygenase (phytanoyl-CoA dioxygenase family)